MKPFKTYEEQIQILKNRGLTISGEDKYDLENENYYNVINGYKDLFLMKKPASDEFLEPETYITGTSFKEVFSLYKLDRRLRNTIIEYLLVFETHLKSRIAYYFSEKYSEPHSYLYFQNYSDNEDSETVLKTVATLSSIMTKTNKQPIKHYISHHDGVPFWVLMNYLTIGNVSYLFQILDEDIKNNISKSYSDKFKREYGHQVNIQSKDIEGIVKQVNFFRNVCAHEERLYDFKINKQINSKNLTHNYNSISNKHINNNNLQSKLFDMLVFLIFFLNKRDYENMIKQVDEYIDYYLTDISSITKDDIYNKMGCLLNNFTEIIDLKLDTASD
ncbi:Abi family protein [Staphylococcus hyicus]|uniref:Abi family protein n=1 Tax=Staphylococcus hyicus TaxID=1284 RepID=UPI002A809984|nr:Abi family protein [Staphylococcus hyicus]MDY3696927.1 Abi family protein [Staphylococcus hyicus]